MPSPESAQSSGWTDDELRTPEYRTSSQEKCLAKIARVRQMLAQIPERSSCLHCETKTRDLVLVEIQNENYGCTIPVPVCHVCVQKPPFVLKGFNGRLWLVAGLIALALACAIGKLWLLTVLTLCGVGYVIQVVPGPVRISAADRCRYLREILDRVTCIQSLLEPEPAPWLKLPLRDPCVSLGTVNPLGIFDDSLGFYERVMFHSSFRDLDFSGVNQILLVQLITRITEFTKSALSDKKLNKETAVQVDYVLLPGRAARFEVQVISKNAEPLQDGLVIRLSRLPSVPVRWPILFSYRRSKEHGVANLDQFSPPFMSWRGEQGWKPGQSYSEKAMNIFGTSPEEPFIAITIEDCEVWRISGAVSDPLALIHVDLLLVGDRPGEALAVMEEQIKTSPENPDLRFRLALLLEKLSQEERAAAVCQQLLQELPEFTEGFCLQAHLQLQLGRVKDAQETLRSAPHDHRSPRFWLISSRVASEQGDYGTAFGYLNTAILKSPNYAEAYLTRGQLLCRQRKFSQALDDAKQAEKQGRFTFEVSQLKCHVFSAMGEQEQAINAISEGLLEYPFHPHLLLLRADALTNAGKLELARVDCDSILERYPQSTEALELRSRIHLEGNDAQPALVDAEQAVQLGRHTTQIYYFRGLAKSMLGSYDEAIDDLIRACEISPGNIYARYHLAQARAEVGQTELAIEDLAEILSQAESAERPRVVRGFLYLHHGQYELAADDFDHVLKQTSTNVEAYRGRSLVHEAVGEKRDALLMLDKALKLDPENAGCLMNRSRLLLDDNDLKGATKDLDSVLSSLPNLLPALLSRAQVRLQLGQIDDAQKDFDAILRDNPEFTPALIGRSVLRDQKGEQDLAQDDQDAAIQNSPEHADDIQVSRLLLKAFLAHRNEQYDDTIQAASEALAINPGNVTAYRYRAGAYWYSESFVEALQDYASLIEMLELPDLGALNGRGQVYAELGEYELALKDLETAVGLGRKKNDRGLPYCLSGLGKTLTGLGRYEEAEAVFRESLALQPDNGWLHFNRGLLHLSRNEDRSAGICFELALRLENPRLSPRKRLKAEAFVARLRSSEK